MAANTASLFASATLLRPNATTSVTPADAFANKKYVALYFSAHWCGPCRQFTPRFAETYKAIAARDPNLLEAVFVSADQDEDDFTSYRNTMPWVALDPFEFSDVSEKLRSHFKVEGFPTLTIVEAATGKVVTEDAVQFVVGDASGAGCPWAPKQLREILTDSTPLVGANHVTGAKTIGELRAKGVKHIAIYFSAHWCPPCRGFTPVLTACYRKMASQRSDFEFIFASSDNAKAEFEEYHATMGFAAFPFRNDAVAALKTALEVRGIPTLATLELCADGDVKLVNAKARGQVNGEDSGADFPWQRKPSPAVIVFEQAQALFDALEEHPHVAVLDLQHVPAASTAAVTDLVAAAVARQRASGNAKVQFCTLPSAAPRAPGCCPDGCALTEQESKRGMQCDGCREEVPTGTLRSCRKHNFDLCATCFDKGVNVEPAGRGLFSRLSQGTKATGTGCGFTVFTNVARNAGFGGFFALPALDAAAVDAAVAAASAVA